MITFEFPYEAYEFDENDEPVLNDDGEQVTVTVTGKFEADDEVLTDYEFVADVLTADEDPKAMVRCFRAVFAGRDREYARVVGGKVDTMGRLLQAALEAVGEAAKN